MYVKTLNYAVKQYPYSIGQLRADNPGTSFPVEMTDGRLAEWGVFPVAPTPQPEVDYTQNATELDPVKTGDEWVQTWQVTDATDEEIAQRTQDQAQNVRAQRDQLLTECDWVVIKSVEVEVPELEAWKAYRQALRDIPQQEGFPWAVVWPEKP